MRRDVVDSDGAVERALVEVADILSAMVAANSAVSGEVGKLDTVHGDRASPDIVRGVVAGLGLFGGLFFSRARFFRRGCIR